jgi:anti-sigma factor RsiW
MRKPDHLTDDLLVRAMDDELPGGESVALDSHLSRCEECRHRYQELRSLSNRIESTIAAVTPEHSRQERESLARALESREQQIAARPPQKILRRFGWGMAIAATLAVGILFGPQWTHRNKMVFSTGETQASTTIEVDGETFVALPYSNPDLPLTSPHVVQMQVSASSLTDAGVVFEPISSQVSAPDRLVLADVLLGIDGQPLGVHVLSTE